MRESPGVGTISGDFLFINQAKGNLPTLALVLGVALANRHVGRHGILHYPQRASIAFR